MNDILPYLFANWWYFVLGLVCAVSYLFGFRKAATVWGLVLLVLMAFALSKNLGPTLTNLF